MKKKMNKKGFTLVEIIVVLVIIAIMAGFAIPAYTGYVDKAKQSEVLATGRAVLVAAQTAGQEAYSLDNLAASVSTTVGSDAETVGENIVLLAGTTAKFSVTIGSDGIVDSLTVTLGEYTGVYDGANWTTSKATTVTTNLVTIVA